LKVQLVLCDQFKHSAAFFLIQIETIINKSKVGDTIPVIVGNFAVNVLRTSIYMMFGPYFMAKETLVWASPGSLKRYTVGNTGHTNLVFIISQVNEIPIRWGEMVKFFDMGSWHCHLYLNIHLDLESLEGSKGDIFDDPAG
jgi:hypothetical protein